MYNKDLNIYERHVIFIVKNGIRAGKLYFMHNTGTVIEISSKKCRLSL